MLSVCWHHWLESMYKFCITHIHTIVRTTKNLQSHNKEQKKDSENACWLFNYLPVLNLYNHTHMRVFPIGVANCPKFFCVHCTCIGNYLVGGGFAFYSFFLSLFFFSLINCIWSSAATMSTDLLYAEGLGGDIKYVWVNNKHVS